MSILRCFEVVSSLKIISFKSELIGIRIEDQAISKLADVLGCKVGSFPTSYLSLPLCLGTV